MNRITIAAFAVGVFMGLAPCLVARVSDGKADIPAGGNFIYFEHAPELPDIAIAGELKDGNKCFVFQDRLQMSRTKRIAEEAATHEVVRIAYVEPRK